MQNESNITEFILAPFIFALILILARIYSNNKRKKHPEYRYFLPGLFLKLFGAFGIWYVYTFYYPGGDTMQYYASARTMVELFYKSTSTFFSLWLGPHDIRKIAFIPFDEEIPGYYRDPNSFFVVRLIVPLIFVSFSSYLVCAFLLATISYFGVWSLYRVFISEYPELAGKFAIAIFYIPSVFFWGSGILKDTITFSMVSLFVAAFYGIFIKRKTLFKNTVILIIATFIILSIKPYIFMGLVPGSLFWIVNRILSRIKGSILRLISTPLLILLIGGCGYILLLSMEGSLGYYSLENVLIKAAVSQRDLKSEYYKGNSFDIGDFDPTISSMIRKAPAAINVALFRPYIWEANNPVMFLSAIENLVILLFTLRILVLTRFLLWFKFLPKNHLLTFSIIFSLFFAFSVGISTSNFGSMVRYKIPAIPFFICSFYIIEYLWKKEKALKQNLISSPVSELVATN